MNDRLDTRAIWRDRVRDQAVDALCRGKGVAGRVVAGARMHGVA